jgi:glucosamine-6-phosphate deaminase
MLHQTYRTNNSGLMQYGFEPDDFVKRHEKMPVAIFPDANQASVAIAQEIAALIRQRQQEGKNCVLGLATGSSPIKVYDELVRMHQKEGLSFVNVITFNLDEYYPIHPKSLQSYNRFMHEYLFDHIDILPENIHIPDGTLPKDKLVEYCRNYDHLIELSGWVDIQLLGIGRTGHIGFNEPGSHLNSPTRIITLDHITRTDASSDFFGEENVPRTAITMGVGSIMKSKKIILMAWGEGKAPIIRKAVEEEVTDSVPTSYLQYHPQTRVILDQAASAELTRIKTPWLVGSCDWNNNLVRKAVVWLCQKQGKPILKLTDRDYNDNGMSDLVAEKGPSNKINIKVFNDLQHTITGWPGGKPDADDSTRPERALPFPKRVVVFSPHPDDDVISMGGTLARLVEQGHIVHTVYQTSGNIAVFDDDVLRFLDFTREYKQIFDMNCVDTEAIYRNIKDYFLNKKPGQIDSKEIQQLKTAIRRGEAKAAVRYVGVPEEKVHFLDLPFYETGVVKKKPLSETDIQITIDLLQQIKPHQIYAAGDLSDPHGTHRVCMNAILEALYRLKDEAWIKDCHVWLYRGAWQEWDIDQAEMAVPLSPEEVYIKRNAIFKHQSQKDRPLFPGADNREFWQRAEERNHHTAMLYDKMGMAEYEAIEVFVRYQLG